jgi:hypothetical protein
MHRNQIPTQNPAYVDRNFARLQETLIEELTRYSCAWSVYSLNVLNTVASMQGLETRLDGDVIVTLRKHHKRIKNPQVAALIRNAEDVHSMNVGKIMSLIEAEVSELGMRRH